MLFYYPIRGLDLSQALVRQPPETTVDALNHRPRDVFQRRGRGGPRPGLDRSFYTTLGGGNPVRLLNTVNTVGSDNFDFWSDSFAGTALSSVWSAGQFSATPAVETVKTLTLASNTGTTEKGAVAASSIVTDFSATAYRVGLFIVPIDGTHAGTYKIHARMDATTPVSTTDGIVCELVLADGGVYSGTLKRYVAGVLTSHAFTGGTLAGDMPGWFELDVSSSTTVKCYWRGNLLVTQTVDAAVGNRVGFSLVGSSATAQAAIDRFRIQYFRTSKYELARSRAFASANGLFYRETYFGWMEQVSANPTLLASDRVASCEFAGKLYMADWSEPLASATDGTNTTTTFDSATYSDWTTLGLDTDDHSLQIISGTQTGANETLDVGMHALTTIGSGSLTLTTSPGPAATAITFRLVRHPKKYDPSTNAVTAWTSTRFATGTIGIADGVVTFAPAASEKLPVWIEGRNLVVAGKWYVIEARDSDTQFTLFDRTVTVSSGTSYYVEKGKVPIGCRLMCRHGGRIYMAGDPTAPMAWYACREDDPDDWDYTTLDDPQGAMSGALAEVGKVGEPITALCPWHRDLMMFGSRNSLWLLSGNPRVGSLQQISHKIGIVESGAWCTGPQAELVFLSRDGLYITDTTCLSCEPKPLSRGILPVELQDLSPTLCTVHMEYDVRHEGIEIKITYKNSRDGVTHWWFDLETRSLWKQKVPKTMEPTAICYYHGADAEDDGILLGGRDGVVRCYRESAETDEGTSIDEHVYLGPIQLGIEPHMKGKLAALQLTFSEESADVIGTLHRGKSPGEAYAASGEYSMTFSAGTSSIKRPSIKDGWAYLKLTAAGDRPYAFEYGTADVEPLPTRVR